MVFYYFVVNSQTGIKITFAIIYIIVVTLLLFLSTAIAITFARRLTKPIVNLIGASEDISRGVLNTKVPEIEADEEFKKLHDPEFMFIRQTELITLDEWITNMEEYAMSGAYAKNVKERRRTSLIHENRHVTEWRWEEGSELVTHVCMKKRGRAWRSIVYRETIEDFQETLN